MPRVLSYSDLLLGSYYRVRYRFQIGTSNIRTVTEDHYIVLTQIDGGNIRGRHPDSYFTTVFSRSLIVEIEECSYNDYYNTSDLGGYTTVEDTGPTIQEQIRARQNAQPPREPKEWNETEVVLHRDGVCVI